MNKYRECALLFISKKKKQHKWYILFTFGYFFTYLLFIWAFYQGTEGQGGLLRLFKGFDRAYIFWLDLILNKYLNTFQHSKYFMIKVQTKSYINLVSIQVQKNSGGRISMWLWSESKDYSSSAFLTKE